MKKGIKIKKPKITANFKRRGYRAGISAGVIIAALLINAGIGQLPENLREIDMTSDQLYTVSDVSTAYLQTLDEDIEVIILAEEGTVDERIVKFVKNYCGLSGRLTFKEEDPVTDPSLLSEYDAESSTIVVRNQESGKQTEISLFDLIGYDMNYMYYYGQYVETSFDVEGRLTSAVDYVAGDYDRKLYLMSGHGESEFGSAALSSIEKLNLVHDTVNLLVSGGVPEDCDLLISYGPSSDLAPDELVMIREYMAQGGQVMMLMAESDDKLLNWEALLEEYGLLVEAGYIADTERFYQQFATMYAIYPVFGSSSEITSSFRDSDGALLLNSRGMTEIEPERDTIELQPLLYTSSKGFAVSGENEVSGSFVLGAVAVETLENGKSSRLTVFGSENMINEYILTSFPNLINLELFVNSVTAGFDDISNISVPAKSLTVSFNTIQNPGLWSLLFIVFIPLAVLIGGLVYWVGRRKR